MKDFTPDTFFNGLIRVRQGKSGYRFSIDSVLIAHHAGQRPGETVLELGAGCGIISLIMALREPGIKKIYGIEIQKELAQIAKWNVRANGMKNKIQILRRDFRSFKFNEIEAGADLVVSNPPFRKNFSGRRNPNLQKAIARHEIKATLKDVIQAARRALSCRGRLVVLYPSQRLTDVLTEMKSSGIEPKFLRIVYSSPGSTEAKLAIIYGAKGRKNNLFQLHNRDV